MADYLSTLNLGGMLNTPQTPSTPQVPQQPTQQPTQPQSTGESLDPSIVALTKAIGQAESGGSYTTPSGDPGSPATAYQFTPGFIEKWAPSILGNKYQPGQQLTPPLQDELAYGAVKTMGTTGDPGYSYLGKLTPAQIASAWNAGDPNAYLDPNYGKNNKYGSTQNYVNKVQEYYQKNFNPQSNTASNPLVPSAEAASGAPNSSPSLFDQLGQAFSPESLGKTFSENIGTAGPAAAFAALGLGGLASLFTAGGLTSKVVGMGKSALTGLGIDEALKTAGGLVTGGTPFQSQQGAPQPAPQGQGQPNMAEMEMLQAEMPQANNYSKQLYQTQEQAMANTIADRRMLQDPNIRSGMETNALFGFTPEVDKEGNMNWQPAIAKSQKAVGDLSEGIRTSLEAEGERAPIQFAVQEAKKELHRTTPSHEWAEGEKEIDNYAKSYQENFGDKTATLGLHQFQRMKQELGHGKKWGVLESTAKKRAAKSMSTAARRTIEHHTKHKELYNRVMKMEQGLINGQKIAQRLNGKKSPKNQGLIRGLAHSLAGRYIPLAIGDKVGGPLGAVLGSMVGEFLTGKIDKKFGKTIFETPAMRKALSTLDKKSPLMYRKLTSELQKAGVNMSRESLLRLPSPAIRLEKEKKKDTSEGVVYRGQPSSTFEQAKKKKERMAHQEVKISQRHIPTQKGKSRR